MVAPLAASLINFKPSPDDTLRISSQTILGGTIALQGIGFRVSVLIYSAFIYRLLIHGLPSKRSLPSMFVSVGRLEGQSFQQQYRGLGYRWGHREGYLLYHWPVHMGLGNLVFRIECWWALALAAKEGKQDPF
jgi:hypothetical protein